jgi:hypothetical protein
LQLHEQHPCGFKASFNRTFVESKHSEGADGWISPYCFGLNLGPIVLMIENHRTGMLWDLMRGSRDIVRGLREAGFSGGWLNAASNKRSD